MTSAAMRPTGRRGGVAALNAIEQMFFIPAYPFWSLAVIAMDVVALYGLCLYGSRENVEAAASYEGDSTD
jgi:hypothetical protein